MGVSNYISLIKNTHTNNQNFVFSEVNANLGALTYKTIRQILHLAKAISVKASSY